METHEVTDEDILAAKATLEPAMSRQKGLFECTLCGERQSVDGNCPNDDIPLRLVPPSEH